MPIYDVVTVTETKVDCVVTTHSTSIYPYLQNRQDRSCYGDGLITYIKASLKPQIPTIRQEEATKSGLEVTLSAILTNGLNTLILVGVYRPPSSSSQWFSKFNQLITDLLSLGKLVVLGDLNVGLLNPLVICVNPL